MFAVGRPGAADAKNINYAENEQICRYSNDYVRRYPFSNTETFREPACTAYSVKTSLFSRKGKPAVISTRLLNHLIRLDQHVLWYHKAKLLRGLKVDENLEF